MTKQTRTILFWGFIAIFSLITPLLVMYAQGYRFDIEKLQVVKTGALFVQTNPYPVDVTIDGTKKKSSNFLFRNIFISNLLPRLYDIDISKEGYNSWNKKMQITAGLVTETAHITLYPIAPKSEIIHENTISISNSPDNETSIVTFFTEDNTREQLGLYISSEDEFETVTPLLYGETVQDVIWSQDQKRMLVVLARPGYNPRLLIGSTIEPYTFSFVTLPASKVKTEIVKNDVRWQWSNDDSLLYVAITEGTDALLEPTRALYSIDLIQKKISGPILSHIHDFLVFSDGIVVLENSGQIVKYSHTFKDRTEILDTPYASPKNSSQIIGSLRMLLVYDNNDKTLHVMDTETNSFVLVDSGIEDVFVSPDQYKVAFKKNNAIMLYWLKDMLNGYKHEKGNMEEIVSSENTIYGISWLFSPFQYIAFTTEAGLSIAEIDARDTVNIVKYPQFNSKTSISWNSKQESLLVLTGSTLQKIYLTE